MVRVCQITPKKRQIMCLSIPAKVVKISANQQVATVETMGVSQDVRLDLLANQPKIGDFVLVHIGYAMNIIDEDEALKTLEIFEALNLYEN